MYHFFRWVIGYLQIRLSGDYPERFFQMLVRHQIPLRDIVREGSYVYITISLPDFFRIKPLVKKARIKVAVIKRYGLPFFILRVRKRTLFFLGFVGIILFLITMKQFLWAFQFEGNRKITDDAMIHFLDDNEVTYGTRIDNISFEKLEENLRESFPEFLWVSVGVEGTKLKICVKENEMEVYEKEDTDENAYDISSTKNGRIISLITRRGVPQVKEGDLVTQGQVLVNGVCPIISTDGTVLSYQLVKADADILIEYDYSYQDYVSCYKETVFYTGENFTEAKLRIFNKEITHPLISKEYLSYDVLTDYHQAKILDNFYLPFWYISYSKREYRKVSLFISKEDMRKELEKNLNEFITNFDEKRVQNIQKDVKIYDGGFYMELSGKLVIQEFAIEHTLPKDLTQIPENSEDEGTQ